MIIDDLTTEMRLPGYGPGKMPSSRKPVYHLKRENNNRRRNAMTFSCLGKVTGTSTIILNVWKSGLEQVFLAACRARPLTQAPLVIGLAESGIIPSALFHQIVRRRCPSAGWICSTRRPSTGAGQVRRRDGPRGGARRR